MSGEDGWSCVKVRPAPICLHSRSSGFAGYPDGFQRRTFGLPDDGDRRAFLARLFYQLVRAVGPRSGAPKIDHTAGDFQIDLVKMPDGVGLGSTFAQVRREGPK